MFEEQIVIEHTMQKVSSVFLDLQTKNDNKVRHRPSEPMTSPNVVWVEEGRHECTVNCIILI